MKNTLLCLVQAAALSAIGTAALAGGPAYPANWNGGAPLAPINDGFVVYNTTSGYYGHAPNYGKIYHQQPSGTIIVQGHPQVYYDQPSTGFIPHIAVLGPRRYNVWSTPDVHHVHSTYCGH
jgi:hypothetical protein